MKAFIFLLRLVFWGAVILAVFALFTNFNQAVNIGVFALGVLVVIYILMKSEISTRNRDREDYLTELREKETNPEVLIRAMEQHFEQQRPDVGTDASYDNYENEVHFAAFDALMKLGPDTAIQYVSKMTSDRFASIFALKIFTRHLNSTALAQYLLRTPYYDSMALFQAAHQSQNVKLLRTAMAVCRERKPNRAIGWDPRDSLAAPSPVEAMAGELMTFFKSDLAKIHHQILNYLGCWLGDLAAGGQLSERQKMELDAMRGIVVRTFQQTAHEGYRTVEIAGSGDDPGVSLREEITRPAYCESRLEDYFNPMALQARMATYREITYEEFVRRQAAGLVDG